MSNPQISIVTGRLVSVRGNDIDTDRIIPARFMKDLTFENLGRHVFEDDRKASREKGEVHPFDDPINAGASILLVDRNFGCGSSREHAPQAIHRWGIKAIVGESFGEIFAGNCISVGMPCVRVSKETVSALRDLWKDNPARSYTINLQSGVITTGNYRYPIEIADGPRKQFLEGSWDPVAMLLSARAEVDKIERKIPNFLTRSDTAAGPARL